MKKLSWLTFILIALALAACQPTDLDQPAATAPLAVAATATPMPLDTELPAPEATEVFTPIITNDPASPTPVPTATVTPTPTATPIPSSPVSSIRLEPVLGAGQLVRPLFLTHAGDARLFVLEQPGRIRIIENGTLRPEPFLDIVDRVGSGGNEQGLLGLAFHPDYATNGRFFVNYTDKNGDTHVSRFNVRSDNPNRADPASEVQLLFMEQPFINHNGGMLAFGPDGYLYVAAGDGGSGGDPEGNGQNPATLLGSLLRLDIDFADDAYAIPPDNPFVGDDGRANEIWAWGLRNPWRFSFDRVTGDLFIADVGQNTYEEVSFEPAGSAGGLNYGWAIMEGNHCFGANNCDTAGLVLPIFEYNHATGCSVTGGYMYRGSANLALYGNYFVGDFCSGIIWRLFPNGDGTWDAAKVLDTEHFISSFGEDVNGELYITDLQNGSIWRIVP